MNVKRFIAVHLGLVVLGVFVMVLGCNSLQRRFESATTRTSIPVYQEEARAELEIVKAKITTIQAWLDATASALDILSITDNEAYAKLREEVEANLAHLQARQGLLEAAIPVLPAKPTPPTVSIAPLSDLNTVGDPDGLIYVWDEALKRWVSKDGHSIGGTGTVVFEGATCDTFEIVFFAVSPNPHA